MRSATGIQEESEMVPAFSTAQDAFGERKNRKQWWDKEVPHWGQESMNNGSWGEGSFPVGQGGQGSPERGWTEGSGGAAREGGGGRAAQGQRAGAIRGERTDQSPSSGTWGGRLGCRMWGQRAGAGCQANSVSR